jgi:hypothetical protein
VSCRRSWRPTGSIPSPFSPALSPARWRARSALRRDCGFPRAVVNTSASERTSARFRSAWRLRCSARSRRSTGSSGRVAAEETVFVASRSPASPSWLLLREARHERIDLLVAEICFDEAVNLFREDVEEALRQARKAERALLDLGAVDKAAPAPSIEDAVQEYRQSLRFLLDSANAQWLPYPVVAHDVVARRALSRLQPFDRQGRNGYRDVLLWESILAAANASDPIVLVSRDADAFGSDRKGNGLASELADELEACGYPRLSVRRIASVSEFRDTLPSVPALVLTAEHLIASQSEIRQMVWEGMEEEALDYDESQTWLIGLPVKVVEWWIHEVKAISPVRVETAREIDGDRVALDLRAEIRAVIRAMVDASEPLNESEGDRIVERKGGQTTLELNRLLDSGFEGIHHTKERWITPGHSYSFIPIGDF